MYNGVDDELCTYIHTNPNREPDRLRSGIGVRRDGLTGSSGFRAITRIPMTRISTSSHGAEPLHCGVYCREDQFRSTICYLWPSHLEIPIQDFPHNADSKNLLELRFLVVEISIKKSLNKEWRIEKWNSRTRKSNIMCRK